MKEHSRGRVYRPSIGADSVDSSDTVGVRNRHTRSVLTNGLHPPKTHVTTANSQPTSGENVASSSSVYFPNSSKEDHYESFFDERKNSLDDNMGSNRSVMLREDMRRDNLELQGKNLNKKPASSIFILGISFDTCCFPELFLK